MRKLLTLLLLLMLLLTSSAMAAENRRIAWRMSKGRCWRGWMFPLPSGMCC